MSNIKWLIQDVGIYMVNLEDNFNTLKRLGFNYSSFGVIAHEKDITNLENILSNPNEGFIIRGGTKILSLLKNVNLLSEINRFVTPEQTRYSNQYVEQLKNGVFYNEETFDQAYYGNLDLPLLNKGASLYSIKDNLYRKFDKDMFLKPSKDQKAFNAGILEAGQTIENFILSQSYQKTYIEEIAVVAQCKKIIAEYRFFVVDKEVITCSRYRFADKVNISEIVPDNIKQAAKEYARLYQPHGVFTIDLAETPEGIFIVEYNCWNASGLYKTNIAEIFNAVQDFKINQMKIKAKNRI